MPSDWKVRIMLFVHEDDVRPATKAALGAIFADNGSGEALENESGLFDAAIKLSTTGTGDPQVFGIETALLFPDMRGAMIAFLSDLIAAAAANKKPRYYVVANVELPQYFAGELIQDNKAAAGEDTLVGVPPWDTTPFTMQDALDDLDERGLQVIPD